MNLFELVNSDDPVTLFCLCAILAIVGSNMVDPQVKRWGWRGGGVAYILFTLAAVCILRPPSAAELARIAFRGLFAAWGTAALLWIGLSVVMWLVRSVKLPKPKPRPIVLTRGATVAPPPPPPSPLPPKPTQEDLHNAAIDKFKKNMEIIEKSPLPDEMKAALKQRETELLAGVIQKIMGV